MVFTQHELGCVKLHGDDARSWTCTEIRAENVQFKGKLICGRKFTTRRAYKQHLKNIHKINNFISQPGDNKMKNVPRDANGKWTNGK